MATPRNLLIAAITAAMVLVASCSDGGGESGATTTATAATTATATSAPATTVSPATTSSPSTTATPATSAPAAGSYYLSLGDSYASGFEAGVGNTRNGFAYQVADQSQASPQPLELINLGCAGATTGSLLNETGCAAPRLGPGAPSYDTQTQLEAAEAVLEEHAGEVALVTVSIGGNDVTRCAQDTDIGGCLTSALGSINANLPTIVQRLRAAAGDNTVIVGTTYPDVLLGEWVGGAPNGQQLATLSVTAFKDLINPALAKAYATAGVTFVDVTAATGAYGPLTDLTELAPYGSIPVPVAQVCELTYYCSQRDIHPNAAGYKVIADLVFDAFVKGQPAGG